MQVGSIDEGFAEIEAGVNAHSDMDAISYLSFSVSVRIRGLLAKGRSMKRSRLSRKDSAPASSERSGSIWRNCYVSRARRSP